jgi:hypothetical protein
VRAMMMVLVVIALGHSRLSRRRAKLGNLCAGKKARWER